jgi:lincosamide nucleotidyltransferase A/C/D/E
MMQSGHVLAVIDALDAAGVRAWVDGGWGVDALVGRQTRDHDDVDLAVDRQDGGFDRAVAALEALGFEPTIDDLPIRLVVDAGGGRSVDLHPLRFGPDGNAYQSGDTREYLYPADGFTTGRIGGRAVPCLGAAIQHEFHAHYDPRPVDHHDLALLAELLGGPTLPG